MLIYQARKQIFNYKIRFQSSVKMFLAYLEKSKLKSRMQMKKGGHRLDERLFNANDNKLDRILQNNLLLLLC